MKVKLDLNDKNWAKFDDDYSIDSEAVPRVGEIIDVGESFHSKWGAPSTFIVLDVIWTNVKGSLIPELKCHRWCNGDRQLELEENGWTHGYTK